MNRKTILSSISIVLFFAFVLATPAMARMGSGHRGDGMGGSGDGHGDRGMTDRDSDSRWNRNSATSTKNYSDGHTFKRMQRMSYGNMNNGGMMMELEPYSYSKGVLHVRFYANTQTGSLSDHPVMESMYLEYKNMKYKPVSIDPMRGQYAEGKIEFHLPEAPDHFRIITHGFPNSEEHIFEW